MNRILVIKLGALGDFIQALGPMQAIRRHHAGGYIVLLTTAPFAELARASLLFDDIWIDERAPIWNVPAWVKLIKKIRHAGFDRVYDLQTSERTSWYFLLMGGALKRVPEWSGIAPFCSHPHANPKRNTMHTVDRQAEQMQLAGVGPAGLPDLSFLRADVTRFRLPPRYVLLVPGGARHRPRKRWPAESYAALIRQLHDRGIGSVVIGAAGEAELGRRIAAASASARNLVGQTSLAEIAVLARGAVAAVGNDTGPMHIVAATGCPCLVLFSAASDPALCAPRGPAVKIVQRVNLADLPAAEVAGTLPRLIADRGTGRQP
jgi:ADP-heptose:LPS heptosyltransferase